jgi:antitoxin component YwqK of YwqJK toxin-antitoxin module
MIMKGILFTILLLMLTTAAAQAPASSAEVPYAKLEWKDDVYFWQGKPFTGTAKDQHKNGKPKGEYPFKEGRLHGVVREWWDNGQLSTETHFKNGQRHGLNRYWSTKGELMKEQVYERDKSVSEKHFEVK